MEIYDISQELFSSIVFPGDPTPKREELLKMEKGDVCNLTAVYMCVHNGTHIDAPYHFYKDGKTVEQIPLGKLVGYSYVAEHSGNITENDARKILEKAKKAHIEAYKRILIKGDATVTYEASLVFADANVDLLGNESQTVGPKDSPMAVHKVLLGKEIVLLEGIRLEKVPEGVYILSSAPISLQGSDGSPCRAILIKV